MLRKSWFRSSVLVILVLATAAGLASWKHSSIEATNAAAAKQPEPQESVTVAIAKERLHRASTTSIGTITAIRSITVQNEVAGTVHQVLFSSGEIVERGALLITLDVSVEKAELKEQEARAELARTQLERMQSVTQNGAVSEIEVDRARAELNVALAQVERTKAIIARKTIHAPFRSRVGISDVHEGQYLNEGTRLTTLQGVDTSAYVDFAVAQQVATLLHSGDTVEVFRTNDSKPLDAKIVAVDARIDSTTRNATIRAIVTGESNGPAPGASVRVEIPSGPSQMAIAIPVSALRKGPQGDHVYVLAEDKDHKTRAFTREVQSGTILGDDVLILKGLSVGERVAASGSFKLHEASLVAVANDPQTPDKM